MTVQFLSSGVVLFKTPGIVAMDPACCCDGGGCCPDTLIATEVGPPPIVGTVLEVEIISDTSGCFTVGLKKDMTDTNHPTEWETDDCLEDPWVGLQFSCLPGNPDRLSLIWFVGDPPCGSCPVFPDLIWVFESGQCDPFEFIYYYDLREEAGTGCECGGAPAAGRVRVKITIKP